MLAAVASALALLLSGASVEAETAALTPREKAALLVVAGMPATAGFGGILVRQWNTAYPRPVGSLVFADQEGGAVKTFTGIAPAAASSYGSSAEAFAAGRETAAGLHRQGVDADFAPVLDLAEGPLGSRHFARPDYAVAFARGLGAAACVKHFPGLGSTSKSTDEARVYGALRAQDLAPFRAAVRAGVPCVMVGHAIYPRLGPRRASLEPVTYRLLRSFGFRGVAITDSLGVLGSPYAPYWGRLAVQAGADLVLTTSSRDAARIVEALVPLARTGALDAKVVRVLRYRKAVQAR